MPSAPTPDHAHDPNQSSRLDLVEELERRIVEIEALDDAEIGSFTRWDWMICLSGALIVPALALWWFAA
jgi:hypothetical protein